MVLNKTCLYVVLLCFFFQNTAKVQGGATNETRDPLVSTRSGITIKEFDANVPRAAAEVSIQDCLCQCHWQTFRDRYGRTHGNCKSTDQTGGRWCYVRTPVITYLGNHGHSTCSDLQRSGRYPGKVWSYQACATPYLTSDVCSYKLQNYRQTNNQGNYRNNIKARIGDNSNEGLFKDTDGTILKGNKWAKFPSAITLLGSRPQPTKDRDVKDSVASDKINTAKKPTSKLTTSNDDAVVFG